MISVWLAASGSGEDGDEWMVHEIFSTEAAAQAYCDQHSTWFEHYVEEWEVGGPFLTQEEREAVAWAVSAAEDAQHPADDTLRGLLERMA